jgi:asparagine synthase (glutamine-hydrolysing)
VCGVCGVLNFNGEEVSPVLLRRMTDAIAHRGPDGEGWYRDKGIGLGHRRLAIVDLSPLGHQPMVTRDGRFALSYNGEIYNFLEIKSELAALGYIFRSQTDSEVVLNAWAEWGAACVPRFNGMFAFAIWDSLEEQLSLVRDRYGIKPIYYGIFGDSVVFGSEQRAILQHPKASRNLDKHALLEYFTFQNIFTDRTFNDSIKILPAGTIATFDVRTRKKTSSQYWDFHFSEPGGNVDPREYEEELDRLLRQAVARQLISDVEIGAYLSGGMDSGTLTALASRELPYIKTFTCGFDLSSATGIELSFDERTKAEAMSALFKTEHYEMVLKAGDMERCLQAVAKQIEEPRVGQSYPNFYVAQLASKFVKVVLSGAGGDEIFGGYPWRYFHAYESQTFETYVDHYYSYWQRLVSSSQRDALFAPISNEVDTASTREIFREVFLYCPDDVSTPNEFINHSLYFEAKTFLHGLLVIEDKLSMKHSLETRVPFLDNDLVDFAMRCPVDLKVNVSSGGRRLDENAFGNKKALFANQSNDGKQILRTVMERYVPVSVTKAVKQGFSSPDSSWFKGESVEFVKRNLLDRNALIYEFFDRATVASLINDHISGQANRRLLIWSLLVFEALLT